MNGWLSPDGVFSPCPIGQHHDKAKEIIESYPETWDTQTWVQITPDSAFSELTLTEAQIKWLLNSGNRFYQQDAKMMRDRVIK
jgi:hypothetical protein